MMDIVVAMVTKQVVVIVIHIRHVNVIVVNVIAMDIIQEVLVIL